MFLIDSLTNTIRPLKKQTFTELKFKERAHLQEWIAENPESLGESLLIIQKEFSKFSDTNERLDLLALDKEGNLVIIENKLDDSGRDVTWQALKYAAYCSTLTKDQIEEIFQSYLKSKGINRAASEILEEFLEEKSYTETTLNRQNKQRIIFIAANFRKEVTSTVLWLMNYNIQLQCFKAVPYELDGQHFLTLDQIIPTKDAKDYVISMAKKTQEEVSTSEETKSRHKIRLSFWAELLKEIKGKSTLFQASNPTKDHWLVAGGLNIQGLSYQLIVTMTGASVLLSFARPIAKENKDLFDTLKQWKVDIEHSFGAPLEWERSDDMKSSKLSFTEKGPNYFNQEEWPYITSFLIEHVNKLEKAVSPYLIPLKGSLNMLKDSFLLEE
jgi:hypothetical protein